MVENCSKFHSYVSPNFVVEKTCFQRSQPKVKRWGFEGCANREERLPEQQWHTNRIKLHNIRNVLPVEKRFRVSFFILIFPFQDHIFHVNLSISGHILHVNLSISGHIRHVNLSISGHVLHVNLSISGHILHVNLSISGHILHVNLSISGHVLSTFVLKKSFMVHSSWCNFSVETSSKLNRLVDLTILSQMLSLTSTNFCQLINGLSDQELFTNVVSGMPV